MPDTNNCPNSHIITIVSGLPRSGTSLMMKMLEAGGMDILCDNIRTADEDNPKGYFEFERAKKLREAEFAWLDNARGKVVKVISALVPHLPPSYSYQIIFMKRALPEILASQRTMLIRRGENPNKVSDDEMTSLFEKHLQQVQNWMASQPNIAWIEINYNQLFVDPNPCSTQINQFLGNCLDTTQMISAIDRGLYRQRMVKPG